MLPSSAVTIVVNGTIVPSSTPARIVAGRVVAPLSPIVVRLAARTAYERTGGSVTIERDGVRFVVPVVYVEDGQPYVELGPVVRGIGGSAAFDSASKTLTIAVDSGGAIATPAPFDPAAAPGFAHDGVYAATAAADPAQYRDRRSPTAPNRDSGLTLAAGIDRARGRAEPYRPASLRILSQF